MIHSVIGYFKEQEKKQLVLDSAERYEEFWSGIKSEITKTNGEKTLFYEKYCSKIKVDTDDDLPQNKALKFPTLKIIVTSVFQGDKKLYPKIYFNQSLYKV